MKTAYSIRRTKTRTKMTYRGDLGEAIEMAKRELEKKQKDTIIREHLRLNYEQAKKELERWDNRIKDLQDFIRAATQLQEKNKEEQKNETT